MCSAVDAPATRGCGGIRSEADTPEAAERGSSWATLFGEAEVGGRLLTEEAFGFGRDALHDLFEIDNRPARPRFESHRHVDEVVCRQAVLAHVDLGAVAQGQGCSPLHALRDGLHRLNACRPLSQADRLLDTHV